MQDYVYDPLAIGEFRLLVVHHGALEHPVSCSIHKATIASDPPSAYETVSYRWGNASDQDFITINGRLATIPASAKAAIRRLRLPLHDRTLWIDAVCINQADLDERSLQVASMGSIYRRAYGNLIHLGRDETLDTSEVVSILSRANDETAELYQQSKQDFTAGRLSINRHISPIITDEVLIALQPLYSLPWFQRLFVVQEATLAKSNTCHWGNSTFPLSWPLVVAFLSASISIRPFPSAYSGHPSQSGINAAAIMHDIVQWQDKSAFTLTSFIYAARRLSTTDPRDKIYALLQLLNFSLIDNTIPELLRPDYRKPVEEVFRDATRFVIQEELGGEQVLGHISHRSEIDISKPSWVFQWSRSFDWEQDSTLLHVSTKAGVDPSGESFQPPRIGAQFDADVLSLEAFVADEVVWATQPLTASFLSDYESVKILLETLLVLTRRDTTILTNLLTGGSIGFLEHGPQTERAFEVLFDYINSNGSLPPIVFPEGETPNTNSLTSSIFYRRFRSAAMNRCFFSTAKGYIGLGPKIMRNGDIIAVPIGTTYPLVLRKPNEESSLLMGAAYISGLMAGEVFSMGLQPTWLNIR